MTYASTLQLAQSLGMAVPVPAPEPGVALYETVGQGTGALAAFALDHGRVLAGSYAIYYGATIVAPTALTETTHYTLAKDTGDITLTSAGITLVATNYLYARYSYVHSDYGFTDTYLATVLSRADARVNGLTNSVFTDGTATNPSWPASALEVHDSQGWFNRRYQLNYVPTVDKSTTLNGALTANATSVVLTSSVGFPTSGRILVDTEIISYTGLTAGTHTLTGCTRGVDSSTVSTHLTLSEVHSSCIQVSGTEQDVQNRFRASYLYGYQTIPDDIVRLALVIAKQMLIKDNVGRAMIAGRNEFNPAMINVDDEEIKSIIAQYEVLSMGNT